MASACLSSPHLRTNSAQEPPRSMVLLGKRGLEEDAGEPTPASKLRSVRQKTTDGSTDLPFVLPQPLFAAGGTSSGRQGYETPGAQDDAGRGEGRGGKGGKGGKKKLKETPNRNRRKQSRSNVRHHQVRNVAEVAVACCNSRTSLPVLHAFVRNSNAFSSQTSKQEAAPAPMTPVHVCGTAVAECLLCMPVPWSKSDPCLRCFLLCAGCAGVRAPWCPQ